MQSRWIALPDGAFGSALTHWRRYSRRRMRNALKEESVSLPLLLANAPTPLLVVNNRGMILAANELASRLCGYSPRELAGLRVEALVPERYRSAHGQFRAGYQQAPRTRRMGSGRELFLLRRDGREVPVEVGLGPLPGVAGEKVLVSLIDLTERSNAEARMRMAIEASPVAIIITDEHGLIQLVNKQSEDLFGYMRSELLGQSIEILLPDELRTHHAEQRRNYVQAPQARPMGKGRELYARHRNGTCIPVEVALSPLHTGEGALVQATIIDISTHRAAQAAQQEYAEQLATASRYKSQFLANMSHELRTPLNSILILSEQLLLNRPNNLNTKQVSHANIIHQSATDLLHLINDILDLAKVESGKMTLSLEQVTVSGLVDELKPHFEPLCQSKDIRFRVIYSHAAPLRLHTDRLRLAQILRNLLSNAVKFTEHGHIELEIAAESGPAEEAGISFLVRDTGIGIPAALQDKIFDAFVQADGSSSRRHGGTGLGLSISRQLAILLGGRLTLSSQPEHGSTFHLWLPLVDTDSTPHSPPLAQADEAAASPDRAGQINRLAQTKLANARKVLLVDDDIRNIYALSSLLEAAGMQVEVAQDGKEALDLLAKYPADIVLMDMSMPVMDGFEATTLLRRQCQYTGPIIALTAHAMASDRQRCLQAGANDYLAKPVSEQQLLDMIGHWCKPSE